MCLNLIDEAERHGIKVNERRLARDLGVPVVPTAARYGRGLDQLLQAVSEVATGQTVCKPRRIKGTSKGIQRAVKELARQIEEVFPGLPNARWVALRLLDGDPRIVEAIRSGELGSLGRPAAPEEARTEAIPLEVISWPRIRLTAVTNNRSPWN